MQGSRVRRTVWIVAAAIVGVLSALAYAAYRPTIARERARIATGSRVVSSPCGPIEYGEQGTGQAVLVVHGAGGGFDQSLELAQRLVRGGFRVIAPSRFGYLRTPVPPEASVEAQADAHACLLDALGISRVAVMGVSAGSLSALQFALRFPARTRALVLLVPAVYAPRPNPHAHLGESRVVTFLYGTALRSDFVFWAAAKLAHETFVRSVLATPPEVVARASPEEQARIESVLEHILPVSARRAGLLNDARILSSQRRYDLEKITSPTLLISASDDGYHTYDAARYTADHIPHARFIGYPSGGHMLVGRDAAASDEIITFLKAAAK